MHISGTLTFKCLVATLLLVQSTGSSSQSRSTLSDDDGRRWRPIPPPTGSRVETNIEQGTLLLRYRPVANKLAGVVRQVDGLRGNGLSLRLRTDQPAIVIVGAVENDGSMYQTVIRTASDVWQQVDVSFDQLQLSDDSEDEDGKLSLETVVTVVLADPAGFLGADFAERTLSVEAFQMVAGDRVRRPPASASQTNPNVTLDFESREFSAIPTPTGSRVEIDVEDGVLLLRYRPEANKLAGVVHKVDGLSGQGLSLRLKTDRRAVIVIGAVENDGSMYQTIVQTAADDWQQVDVAFDQLQLSNDSKDEDGALNLEAVVTIVLADPAGFLDERPSDQVLRVDELKFVHEFDAADAREHYVPLVPLVTLGPPSPSGARASNEVTFRSGKFGRGVLVGARSAKVVVPVRGLNERQGTIESWISPQFTLSAAEDFSAIFAMQAEPFAEGLKTSLIVFYAENGRIALMVNGELSSVLATPVLDWGPNEWHHLAISWGDRGRRLYVDGRLVAEKEGARGPSVETDLVVGNHAWTVGTHRVSNTLFDELRVSSSQRSEREISSSARRDAPHDPDASTVALEHFERVPHLPVRLAADASRIRGGASRPGIDLAVEIPFELASGAALTYDVSKPDGERLYRGTHVASSDDPAQLLVPVPGNYAEGFYRVDFTLDQNGRTTEAGSDWVRISRDTAPPETPYLFGASGHLMPENPDRFFRLAAAAGVRSYRTAFEWSEIEPEDNTFVWERYDRLVAAADRHGVELVPTLFWELPQPDWAGPEKFQSGWQESKYPPRDLAKWRDYVFHVVERYKESIHWWIPSNEPNLTQFWYPRPDAREYVAFVEATRAAVRRADPEANLLGGSVAGLDLPFLELCFREGLLELVDAVGVHAYIAPHSPDERVPINNFNMASERATFRDGLAAAHALILKYGGTQKLWMDEAGQPYRDDFIIPSWNVPEKTAASHLVKIHVEAFASGAVDRILWFSFFGGEYGSFALTRPDGNPTVPLAAYVALGEWLSSATLVGEGGRGAGIRSFTLRGPRGELEVLWSIRGETTVDLDSTDEVFDMYGLPVAQPDGASQLTLDSIPKFVLRGYSR